MSLIVVTGVTPGPCACCGIGAVVVQCRTRGGNAALCGFPEYSVPSVPAKKYRTQTVSGSLCYYDRLQSTHMDCTGICDNQSSRSYSGSCNYNVSTCALTNNLNVLQSSNPGTLVCNCAAIVPSTPEVVACPFVPRGDGCNTPPITAQTQTSITWTYDGSCCALGGVTPIYRQASGSNTAVLTDEDTDDDAIARLLAGAGGVWSAWTTVGDGTGGTCLATSCCNAHYQQRTTGFTFDYQESQFKADMSGLDPATNYVLNMKVYRRLYGSGDPWSLLLDDNYAFTTDGSGNAEVTDDVLNLVGYETYIAEPLVYKP